MNNLSPNTFDADYLLEVIVASMIERGYDPDTLRIYREGIARRGVSKDVEQIQTQFSQADLEEHLTIKANREGIYDMLPQGLFHDTRQKRKNPDKEDITEKIKDQRQEEFFVRKFFHPFEESADKTLIEAYLYEIRYNRKISNPEFINVYLQYWPLMKDLPHRQAIFFMHIVPIIHKIRVNFTLVQEALAFVLDVPVQITQIKLPAKKADHAFESRLGDNDLAVDMVFGTSFDDGQYDLKIIIGPISANRMRNFLETAKEYRMLQELANLFLPADQFYTTDFIIDPGDSVLVLSDDKQETFLGINSFI